MAQALAVRFLLLRRFLYSSGSIMYLFPFFFSHLALPSSQQGSKLDHIRSQNSKQVIHNNPPGFGNIYLLNMPGRTDGLDASGL